MFLYLLFFFVYVHIIAFHMYYKKDKQKSTCKLQVLFFLMEAPPRFELGIKVLQTYALPLGYSAKKIGADYEARTRYLHLGKVALYQMS